MKRVLVIVGAAIIAAGGITYAVIASQRSPEVAVTSYLQALVDGDATAARSLMMGIPTDTPTMLDDHAYAAGADHITKFTVSSVTVTGEDAVATVELSQAGATYQQKVTLGLIRHDLGIFEVWRVDASNLATVYLSYARPDGMSLTVNRVDFDELAGAYEYDAPAFPGTWQFAPVGGTDFYDAAPVSVTTRLDGDRSTAALPINLTDAGIASATAAMAAQLDGCLAQATIAPAPGCGFLLRDDGEYENAEFSNIVWTLDARPTATFGDWRTDVGWAVIPGTPGAMSATAEFTSDDGDGDTTGTVSGYVQRGTITTIDDAGIATFVSDYE